MKPGIITLIGSGETTRYGGQAFERLIKQGSDGNRVAILETPAGFELNSTAVAGRVADYLRKRLDNYDIQVDVVAARARDTAFSPDDPKIVRPLLNANLIYLGAGSPTYAVRQLRDSLAWELILARLWQGASLVLASAAAISSGRFTLPVYEIYKAGEDPHWVEGLDLFGSLGMQLAIITHWNNREGGADLDTSHCFMGASRFEILRKLLPDGTTILGIDEQTILQIDLARGSCEVLGLGQVHVLRRGRENHFSDMDRFACGELGDLDLTAEPPAWSDEVTRLFEEGKFAEKRKQVPGSIQRIAREREIARKKKDWELADQLRMKLESSGWTIVDTPDGFQLIRTKR